jgi:branched-chain amino acid transport system ATP-binding protein
MLTALLVRLRSEAALSIILVEQNSRVAFAFSERTVIMSKGRIVHDGPSAELRDNPEKLARLVGIAEAA